MIDFGMVFVSFPNSRVEATQEPGKPGRQAGRQAGGQVAAYEVAALSTSSTLVGVQ